MPTSSYYLHCFCVLPGGTNNSSDTESLPSPHSSEDSKAKEEGSNRTKMGPNTGEKEVAGSDVGQAVDEKPAVKEDVAIKQEIKTETGEPSKEQQQHTPTTDVTDKKPPAVETEDVKSSTKNSKKDPGTKSGSHGDSDSSATCSADEVEETDNTDKSRLEHKEKKNIVSNLFKLNCFVLFRNQQS